MGEHFERSQEASVPATPEEVWEAIASGPGIDSWFLGSNRVEPGMGGVVATDFPGIPPTRVEVWDPPHRLVHSNQPGEDGRFIAYEFLVEGRSDSTTVIRVVTSGFIPGDNWEDEFEAMSTGGELFFSTMIEALTHFRGRRATPVTVFGPVPSDVDAAWARLRHALEADTLESGDRVTIRIQGRAPVAGEVYVRNRDTVGIRADDALYRFMAGFKGPMIAAHHHFSPDADAEATRVMWESWLQDIFREESA